MKKFLMLLSVVTLIFGVAASAQAIPFKKVIYEPVWFNSKNTTHTWTFDLNADTDINEEDTINWARLSMLFIDDDWDKKSEEYADIDLDGSSWKINREIDGGFMGAWVKGLLTDHLLTVTVNWREGDFGVLFAKLWGDFEDNLPPTPIPEPATILLMGVGLLGLVGYSRKRIGTKS